MNPGYNELVKYFRKSVVRIEVNQLVDPAKGLWRLVHVVPGIVTVSEINFCHIIACFKGLISPSYLYEVIFPDGTTEVIDHESIERREWLAAFFVLTKDKKVDSVIFNSQNASERDIVRIFGYNHVSKSLLDRGTVTHLGEEDFAHDCAPNSLTALGYPIFTLDNKLVGISYSDRGVTYALNVERIKYLLTTFFAGMENKPLVQIIEHIKGLGQAKSVQCEALHESGAAGECT